MQKTVLNDELIENLIENINNSDNKSKVLLYIDEVTARCARLCKMGETLRVLNEYKYLFDNLRKEFNL